MIFASAGDFGLSWILEIVGLVIVVAIIAKNKYLAPLLNKKMAEKLASIKGQLAAGDEARTEAIRLVEERRAQVEAAKLEAIQIHDQATKSAALLVEDGTRRAEEEYQRYLVRITQEIEARKIRARQAVFDALGVVVSVATEAVVRAELNDTSHHRLIDEAISATESESTGANV